MIYILYSADYELYLGDNFLPETEILINPTYQLLEACTKSGIKVTLFSDIFCLMRYRQLGINEFPSLAEKQMRYAVSSGHDAQAHIHPHWTCTDVNKRPYQFDPRKYLLGTFFENAVECEDFIHHSIRAARDYLQDLLEPEDPSYRCIAFRAGGFGLQPNEKIILSALEESGFMIDSSIVPDLFSKNSINSIDFTRVPIRGNYWLSGEKGLAGPASSHKIFEIPIASARINILEQLSFLPSKVPRYLQKGYVRSGGPRGMSIQQALNLVPSISPRVLRFSSLYHLDMSIYPHFMMLLTKKYLQKVLPKTGDLFFAVNCHPKGMSRAHFEALKVYHQLLTQEFPDVRSISYREAADIVASNKSYQG